MKWHRGEFTHTMNNIIHRSPKYLALYAHKDGYHTPFNGKFAYFQVKFGTGAFVTSGFETL